MRYQSLLYGLFAIALILAGVTWFRASFELREVAEYTGFRGEARENPLFASRMFLRRMGIDARRHDGLDTLPDTRTVLVLDTERFNFSSHRVETLLDWVRRGGHLITRARVDQDTADEGESPFGSRPETEDRDLLQQALGIRIGGHHMPDEDQLPFRLQLDGVPDTLEVELDFFNALDTTVAD
ncbi:MAG: DUF4350 domain-containing protein, partial [Thiothrix sp.]|nr:DUF4350 domain-containing protein [Thiothrix sp.]